jgi:hypothetical protein
MRDEELVEEAFTLIGILRPGEGLDRASLKFGLKLLRFLPNSEHHPSVWLARQLMPIYNARLPEFAQC